VMTTPPFPPHHSSQQLFCNLLYYQVPCYVIYTNFSCTI
jgi:hypothetical protein